MLSSRYQLLSYRAVWEINSRFVRETLGSCLLLRTITVFCNDWSLSARIFLSPIIKEGPGLRCERLHGSSSIFEMMIPHKAISSSQTRLTTGTKLLAAAIKTIISKFNRDYRQHRTIEWTAMEWSSNGISCNLYSSPCLCRFSSCCSFYVSPISATFHFSSSLALYIELKL